VIEREREREKCGEKERRISLEYIFSGFVYLCETFQKRYF
jgi:hypothetical protein